MVAERAGVSFMTVSRVLSAPDRVAPKTRERVLKAIAETGYVVNHAARALAVQRTSIVGVLIPTITNSTYAALVAGLEEPLGEAGYDIILNQTGYSPERTARAVHVMLGRQPDALVLYSLKHLQALRNDIAQYSVPVVEVWSLPHRPLDVAVGVSMTHAGGLAARHFSDRGRKRVAYFGGVQSNDLSRMRGMKRELERIGGVAPVHIRTPEEDRDRHHFERGDTYLDAIEAEGEGVDAVFCSSDTAASAIVFEALRRGYKLPEDLAVCGFGGVPLARGMTPSLTTIAMPSRQMGGEAAQMVLSRCGARGVGQRRKVQLGLELVIGESS